MFFLLETDRLPTAAYHVFADDSPFVFSELVERPLASFMIFLFVICSF
jgi:hypothetical protein